ncbi:MAG: hypothetical protein KDA24_00020 [Deltaproteobacteria bacterium]|nr:hypothetical protein [Deltaproteobacteria bacterium]
MKIRAWVALLLIALLAGCTTSRGGRGSSNDDDASNDDDSAANDDDATANDDDATGDDDDATGDDDDATANDDDATGDDDDDDDDDDGANPGPLLVTASSTDFGNVGIGATASRTVVLTNDGGTPISWSIGLTFTGTTLFTIGGGDSSGLLAGGGSVQRTLTYAPSTATASFTAVRVSHDGTNTSPSFLYFTGVSGGAATESSCANGIDDDLDGFADCDDWDCVGAASCGDPCCGSMPWPASDIMCDNAATLACMCAADSFCCDLGWNQACSDLYSGAVGSCPVPSCP